MNCCHAIINSSTNVVENVVMAHNPSSVFTEEGQSVVLGNCFVKKGMTYDPETGTFPEVGDKLDKKNLIDEIHKLIEEHEVKMNEHFSTMSEDERETHLTYLGQIGDIELEETYSAMQIAWDARPEAPAFTEE